ncbi:MAG TPA: hypothetical protein VK425_06390 [Acidimicrobiales bacterium]|nr:hypothetical protein [Acidimicrobiales bacterium]
MATFSASIGSVLSTFLAASEIDPVSLRKHWRPLEATNGSPAASLLTGAEVTGPVPTSQLPGRLGATETSGPSESHPFALIWRAI